MNYTPEQLAAAVAYIESQKASSAAEQSQSAEQAPAAEQTETREQSIQKMAMMKAQQDAAADQLIYDSAYQRAYDAQQSARADAIRAEMRNMPMNVAAPAVTKYAQPNSTTQLTSEERYFMEQTRRRT